MFDHFCESKIVEGCYTKISEISIPTNFQPLPITFKVIPRSVVKNFLLFLH